MIRTRLWYPLAWVTLAGAMVFGCTRSDVATEPESRGSQFLLGDAGQWLGVTLLRCDPLPYQVVSQRVGPQGGVIKVGPHRLEIPRGALRESLTITAETPSEPLNSVRFQPEGLRFSAKARLTLSYANCQGMNLPKKVVYTDELLSILEVLRSLDDAADQTVAAPIDHFSRYAVAW